MSTKESSNVSVCIDCGREHTKTQPCPRRLARYALEFKDAEKVLTDVDRKWLDEYFVGNVDKLRFAIKAMEVAFVNAILESQHA